MGEKSSTEENKKRQVWSSAFASPFSFGTEMLWI